MTQIAIVYHTTYGHTKLQAEAVHRGAQSVSSASAKLYTVEEATARLDELDAADAIIFGCPTYMGNMSAGMKAFLETAAKKWFTLAWKNKVAGAFTNSSSFSWDKLNTLLGLVINAMQHGMIFVGLGMMPSANRPDEMNTVSGPGPEAHNRVGSFIGPMAASFQVNPPSESTRCPAEGRHRDSRGIRSAGRRDRQSVGQRPERLTNKGTTMRTKIMLGLTAAAFLLLPRANAADNYKIDPAHTSLTFSVRHMGISNVKGHFDEFFGSIVLDNGVLKEASGTIQVKSVNTGVQQRDNHLRTADFFEAAKYPAITFKTKSVEKNGGQILLIADFTMRGVTKELRLPVKLSGPVKDPQGNIRTGLEARTNLNRKDYGINFNGVLETGALLVGEEVALEINAEAIKET